MPHLRHSKKLSALRHSVFLILDPRHPLKGVD